MFNLKKVTSSPGELRAVYVYVYASMHLSVLHSMYLGHSTSLWLMYTQLGKSVDAKQNRKGFVDARTYIPTSFVLYVEKRLQVLLYFL